MKINEVSQVFGIPAETLRYIEQQGLIHPARNAANGYREYDLDTFSELCEYIRFRNMGIPVRQIKNAFEGDVIVNLITEIRQCEQELDEQLRKELMLQSYLRRHLREMETLHLNLNIFRFEKCSSMHYIHAGIGKIDDYEYHHNPLVTVWRKNAPYVSLAYFLDLESLRRGHAETDWVFIAESNDAQALSLPINEQTLVLDETLCISGYTAYHSWADLKETIADACSFGAQHGFEPTGNVLVLPVVRERFSEQPATYARLLIPVRKQA